MAELERRGLDTTSTVSWELVSDEVHDMKGDEASRLANDGMAGMVEYLCHNEEDVAPAADLVEGLLRALDEDESE